ncbi:MAG TPA: hypothetical protein VFS21_17025 [Roseiflexaceae bacterium]|nr:hypothetical protein [Roseiflexaceae bacterium]
MPMSRTRDRLRKQRWALVGLVGVGLALLALPHPTYAGCSSTGFADLPDLGACVDALQYNTWRGVAQWVWQANQQLLLGAHQFDQLRWFLIDELFLTLYQALVNAVEPLVGPLGMLALVLAGFGLILTPVFGSVVLGNLRQILLGLVAIPLAFTFVGPWVVEAEHLRSEFATDLFRSLPSDLPGQIFGQRRGADQDMASPTPLDFTACGDPNFVPNTGVDLQAAAAAILWADWRDIACPQQAGSEQPSFPARWSRPAPDGPGYLYPGDVGEISDAGERARYVLGAQLALGRASWGLIPSLLAQLEAFTQFVFTLCMVLLTLATLLTLLVSLFQRSFAGVVVLLQGAWNVVRVSIMVSGVLSLLTLCLLSAATTGNAQAYVAFSGVSLFVAVWLMVVSLLVLKDCFLTSSTGLGVSAGMMQAPTTAAISAMRAGVNVARQGAGSLVPNATPVLAGATALAAGMGMRYAAGYALGHSRNTLARAGTLALLMRGNSDSLLYQGARTGSHSTGSPLSPHAISRMRIAVRGRHRGDGQDLASLVDTMQPVARAANSAAAAPSNAPSSAASPATAAPAGPRRSSTQTASPSAVRARFMPNRTRRNQQAPGRQPVGASPSAPANASGAVPSQEGAATSVPREAPQQVAPPRLRGRAVPPAPAQSTPSPSVRPLKKGVTTRGRGRKP